MKPYTLGRHEGDAIWMFDSLDTIKADADHSGGSFSLFEFLDFKGPAVPLHINDGWDSGFYILEGRYTFVIKDIAKTHDFHLIGPGVNKKTPVKGKGTFTWHLTLKKGTYTYVCDPHKTLMTGSFKVT